MEVVLKVFAAICALCSLVIISCTRHEVEMKPVEIKPIHITVDVNVRVEKAVDDFYGDIYGEPAK